MLAEGLKSGCEFPLIGRKGVIGVLGAFSRSERAFSEDEFAFLEQVALQVAIAVENALDFGKATEDRVGETKRRLYLEEEIRAEFGAIVGDSPALHLVSVVAPTDCRRNYYEWCRNRNSRDWAARAPFGSTFALWRPRI